MATTPENPTILNISDTYGCMLIGAFLSCIMWGISCLQSFLYFAIYESDPWTKKAFVGFLWVVDTVNEIIILRSLWPVLIQHYGSIHGLTELRPELTHRSWIAQLLELCVQFYFIHRIYIFSGKKKLFPVVMAVMSIYQIICLIPYDVIVYRGGATTTSLSSFTALSFVISLRAVTAAEDAALAATMIYFVFKRGLPEFERSRRMLVRLVVVTVNTGMWTAVLAFIELCLVAKYPKGLQFMVLEFPLCSLYFSSLLASLNARNYVKGTPSTLWNETPTHLVGNRENTSDTLYLGPLKSDGGNAEESTVKVHRASDDNVLQV